MYVDIYMYTWLVYTYMYVVGAYWLTYSQCVCKKCCVCLSLSLQLRGVEYQLQQERESIRSTQSATAAVREQLSSTQERLSREVELREAAELGRRGAELVGRGHQVEGQQAQERIRELTSHLQTEREARAVQVVIIRLSHTLSHRICVYSIGFNP